MPYDIAGDDKAQADDKIMEFLDSRPRGTSFDKAPIKLEDANLIVGAIYDIPSIKQYIKDYGSVFFQFDNVKDDGYDNEHNSFFSRKRGTKYLHAALIVGWDDNYPKENFKNNPSIDGAWLVRNSYGVDNDDEGYFWMSYAMSDPEATSKMKDAYFFIVSNDETLSEDKPASVGATKAITRSWSAKLFQSNRDEDLVEVFFYTYDNNAQCEIIVNNLGKEEPSDPGQTDTPLIIREFPYAGFHTVKLPEPIKLYKSDYYSVIIKTNSETVVEASIENYVSVDVNAQESFFADGDVPSVWEDGKFIDKGPFNAYIRAFTRKRISYESGPQITTSTLPAGKVGEQYNFSLSASGSGTLEWRCGKLPEGIALTRQGALNGQPVNSGRYELKITALNYVGSETKILTLEVASGDISIPVVSDDTAKSQDIVIVPVPPNNIVSIDAVHSSSGSGGGCNSGFEFLCLISALAFIRRRI